jgi:hypothetical protein
MDLIGKSSVLSDDALLDAVTFVTRDALDTMAALCRRGASTATG